MGFCAMIESKISRLDEFKLCTYFKLQYMRDSQFDRKLLLTTFYDLDVDYIWIEKQQPWPWQSSTATFSAGFYYGQLLLEAMSSSCNVHGVNPRTWQMMLNNFTGTSKEKSLYLANILFENRVPDGFKYPITDHNLSDAMLIAYFGLLQYKEKEGK